MAVKKYSDEITSFEVGIAQYQGFGLATYSFNLDGNWLLMFCGDGERVYEWDRAKTKDQIVEMLQAYLLIDWSKGREISPETYEIWHLVDDGDLWQEWDALASAALFTDYHVMDGNRCVLDLEKGPDKVWCLVHVLDSGEIYETRYYDRDHKDQLAQDIDSSIHYNGNRLLRAVFLDGYDEGVSVVDDNGDIVEYPWLINVYVVLAAA